MHELFMEILQRKSLSKVRQNSFENGCCEENTYPIFCNEIFKVSTKSQLFRFFKFIFSLWNFFLWKMPTSFKIFPRLSTSSRES